MPPRKVIPVVKNYQAGIHKFFSVDGASNTMPLDQLTNNSSREALTITSTNVVASNLIISGTFDFSEASSVLKQRIQVNPVRKVFYVESSQTNFNISVEGIYGGNASNVDVFLGQSKLSYFNSNVKDYDVYYTYDFTSTSNTNYTISLTTPAVFGDMVDITVWPQLIQQSAPQDGYVYQKLDLSFFTPTGNSIYYNSGNIGIGTTLPKQALDVFGNVNVSGILWASNVNVIGDFVTLNTVTSNTEQVVIENAGTGPALKVTQTGNNSVAEFYDKESGIALFMGNGGNIGIGTTIPLNKLDINGTTLINGSVGIGTTIPLSKIDIVHSTGNCYASCRGATNYEQGLQIADGTANIYIYKPPNTTRLSIWNGAERFSILSNGNVGIGTVTPTQSLDVVGNVKVSGYLSISNHPAFQVYYNGTNINATTVIVWNQVVLNNGNCYNNTTGRFTAPITGIYWFSYHALGNSGSTPVQLVARLNGTNLFETRSESTYNNTMTCSWAQSLTAGQYIDVVVLLNQMYGAIYNNFSGYLISTI